MIHPCPSQTALSSFFLARKKLQKRKENNKTQPFPSIMNSLCFLYSILLSASETAAGCDDMDFCFSLPFWATNFEVFGRPDPYLGGATRKRTRLLQPWQSRLSISLGRNRSEPLKGVFCKFHKNLIFSCIQL
ncbi:unnamed protein product [Cuscuta epithymum]|uniref:Uncharacterized protein n=1 Tax=Cuscuta epithymum TaxID=186058 RepID=A0AAV0DLC9_9ASTE|nr:unnamed protein product [Cuscuta epithymum]